jgi:hypothetical protein
MRQFRSATNSGSYGMLCDMRESIPACQVTLRHKVSHAGGKDLNLKNMKTGHWLRVF